MRTRLLCLFLTLGIIFTSHAQIKKGSFLLGGDFAVSVSTTKSDLTQDEDKSHLFYLTPVFGKAIKDNLVIGVNATFGNSKSDNSINGYASKNDSYGAGVFIRKYKNIGTSGFYFFLQGNLAFNYSETQNGVTNEDYTQKSKRTTAFVSAYPGISYAVCKNFHIESGLNNLLSLAYVHEKNEILNPTLTRYTTNGFNLSSSLSNGGSTFYLGFRVLMGK